jgi:hypothetical protein
MEKNADQFCDSFLSSVGYFRARISGLSPFDKGTFFFFAPAGKTETRRSAVQRDPFACADCASSVCFVVRSNWRHGVGHHRQQYAGLSSLFPSPLQLCPRVV